MSVEIPNPDPAAEPEINSVYDVQFINISYAYVPEKIQLKVYNYDLPFAIKMQYRNPNTKILEWLRVSDSVTWKEWTAARIRDYVDW